MINHLRYAVSFPTNGISLSGDHSFQPGATAVSGRNGTGKSFISEMIRYGLFGKKALRGPASDYKSLDMALTFVVGGQTYEVTRGKKEKLVLDEEQLAVGADAVNKKIIDILGFGLEVFDVVCVANQKESERLTRLTPTKRKELIDEVVGLTAQEAVEKACRDEANGLRREADALTRSLTIPVEPLKPAGYAPSRDIAVELAEAKEITAKRADYERTIAAVGAAPVEPTEELAVSIEDLEAHEKARVENEARYKALYSSIERIPDATHTREALEAAAALLEYDAEVKRRGPQPDYDAKFLNDQLSLIEAKQKLAHDSVECPQCSHQFDPSDPTIDRAALAALPEPSLTRAQIMDQEYRIQRWSEPLVEPAGAERLSREEIQDGVRALDRAADKATMQAELDALPQLEDRSAELAKARALDRQWDIYARDSEAHMARLAAAHEAEQALHELPKLKATVAELDAAFVAARVYETQVESYGQQKARFDELTAEIADKQQRSEAFAAGAKGLVEARRTLKAFLAPSLSRVSSSIVQQMTVNAKRPLHQIVVDEDMNITVDGQDVSTFNGAHATMVNLALRLALGQVLVSRVMPLFIGDEIDSDLDVDNAQSIVDALLSLKDQLKQVVVISHKRLENFDEEIVL
ncbi:AAA family ATPase [Sphingomonas jaspsi]|uniref:AAA family ATPase n=1 Tax=Sphingomonas jaspsi TaxID=392409 RepID=UPI0004B5B678|nr:AAA family ATPase [Sphingomonas jaspsi]